MPPIVSTQRTLVTMATAVVRWWREREGWGVIVDRQALGAVVEMDSTHDVTPRVLAELRRQAAARVSEREGEAGDAPAQVRGGASTRFRPSARSRP